MDKQTIKTVFKEYLRSDEIEKKDVPLTSSQPLTGKELFVLKAAARGYRNKEIAFDMGIAERTVKAHLTTIFNKLSVNSRTEAVAVALDRGLIHI